VGGAIKNLFPNRFMQTGKENTLICNLLRFNTSDIDDKKRVKTITKYLLKDDICFLSD
jgi:hypothetical protein